VTVSGDDLLIERWSLTRLDFPTTRPWGDAHVAYDGMSLAAIELECRGGLGMEQRDPGAGARRRVQGAAPRWHVPSTRPPAWLHARHGRCIARGKGMRQCARNVRAALGDRGIARSNRHPSLRWILARRAA